MSGAGVTLTCDAKDGLLRVAVWQGKILRDLYLDVFAHPDLSGAIVGGKVARVLAGERSAFVDCGLAEKVFLATSDKLHAGQYMTLRLTSPARQGKAWTGERVAFEQATGEAVGVLVEAPAAWQRALEDLKAAAIKSFVFNHRDAYLACRDWLTAGRTDIVRYTDKEPAHPELTEIIDALRQPRVALSGGGAIVVETVEALTAIDVNAPDAANPLTVNLLAVREAARQIRLRNLAGIIVIDALKMRQRPDNAKILNALQKVVAEDPAGAQVFGLTKLGLIEMTRQRRGATLADCLAKANEA